MFGSRLPGSITHATFHVGLCWHIWSNLPANADTGFPVLYNLHLSLGRPGTRRSSGGWPQRNPGPMGTGRAYRSPAVRGSASERGLYKRNNLADELYRKPRFCTGRRGTLGLRRLTPDERLKWLGDHSLLREGVGQMILPRGAFPTGASLPSADGYGPDSVLPEATTRPFA